MAFIVEMGWGRPPCIKVEGPDENDDWIITDVIPSEEPLDPEWRQFSCSGDV